jgi:ABC-type branched-subunit amino acid transport system ATPase component
LQCADRGYVLELGDVVAAGTPSALIADEKLTKAYLGGG